ncbi:hypothetical protein B0O99DRAFT_537948 [Bisporella sp. PMI_857]|nr:hypothetical protein B0O99DRAFT_537948 [Bisporella sp. PMI_857]
MPPRIAPSRAVASILRTRKPTRTQHYATAAVGTLKATTHDQLGAPSRVIPRYPSTQPPSYKPAEFRKTQLLRSYASLLKSTPLMLIFQHNNLKANEWAAVRRELSLALHKVDAANSAARIGRAGVADGVKLQITQTGIFAAALKIVEFYKPHEQKQKKVQKEKKILQNEKVPAADPATPSSVTEPYTHALSKAAHDAVKSKRHVLQPLLSGPIAVLTFPDVSPAHLKAALSILSPSPPQYPAPTRRANPGWHDPAVQTGIQKLLLLAARVEGQVFDVDGTKWVGGIEGGLQGLQSQLVYMLQSLGGALTSTLEGAAKSLYLTVEGRRTMLEDEEKGPTEEKSEPKA